MLEYFSFVKFLHRPFWFTRSREVSTISVIGSGVMGTGIAQVCAREGYKVYLCNISPNRISPSKFVEKSSGYHQKNISVKSESTVRENKERSMNNLISSSEIGVCVPDSDLVIEAVVEKLEVKQEIFRIVEELASKQCILISNTSSLSLKKISSVIKNKRRFGGLHFFNPVRLMKLVEVVRIEDTSQSTIESLIEFSKSLKKIPVVCQDTPGFVCNRLLIPYLTEAIRLVEQGDVTIHDVDICMKYGAGYPMGPFELADFIGLDTIKYMLDNLSTQLPDNKLFNCPKSLNDLVKTGKLGKKTGEGFLKYNNHGKVELHHKSNKV